MAFLRVGSTQVLQFTPSVTLDSLTAVLTINGEVVTTADPVAPVAPATAWTLTVSSQAAVGTGEIVWTLTAGGQQSEVAESVIILSAMVGALCTLEQVKARTNIEVTSQDAQIESLIPVVLPRLNLVYGLELMPYVTETRTFPVTSYLVNMPDCDLRSVTSVTLHPESSASVLTSGADYVPITGAGVSTFASLRLSKSLQLPTDFGYSFGYEQIAVTGDWGMFDDVSQVPTDINEAAIECVLSWLRKPVADIAGIDNTNPRALMPTSSPAWDIPTSAHRKMQVYNRNLGVW